MAGKIFACSLVLGLLMLCQAAVTKDSMCRQTSSCFYDCGHTVMDLTALKHHMLMDVPDSKGQSKFSYSPCGVFSEGSGCNQTHVCQVDFLDQTATTDVGSDETASLSTSGGSNVIMYTHTTKDSVTRVTTVTLQCASPNEILSQDPQLTVDGENPAAARHYTMTLTSRHACFQVKAKDTTTKTVTTQVTTAQMTKGKPTTVHHKATTENTTPHAANVTTASHKATTEHTTHHGGNVTTASHNATTAHTTPTHTNVTTASHNATTVNTTPAHSNVTTASHNMTTAAMTTTRKNVTVPVVTTAGQTTAPTSAADTSCKTTVLTLVVPAVIALTRL